MRTRITFSVLTLFLTAVPRGAVAQNVHGPIVEPETLALAGQHPPHAVPAPAPAPAMVGAARRSALPGRSNPPLPARPLAAYLCDEARDAIMQGMLMTDARAQLHNYANAEQDARRALAREPESLEARYWLAAAEGMQAGFGGLRHRLSLGEDVYRQAQSILDADPNNAGGHYLMGRLNIEIMTMNGLARFIAGNLLGATLVRQASWEQAEHHLLAAIQEDPRNAVDRLTLARVYALTGRNAQARTQIQVLFDATDATPIKPLLEARARALLASLQSPTDP